MTTTRRSKVARSRLTRDGDDLPRLGDDRRMLLSIIQNSDDAIIGRWRDGTILSWNRGAARLFGYRRAEMIGQSIFSIIPADRVEEERHILRRLNEGERIEHYETVRRRKDGRLLDISISGSPIHDSAGRIVGSAKILRDITDRKQMEAGLRDSEQFMRAILDTAADAIITIDERGIIQSSNAATRRLFGYSARELIGRDAACLMPESFRADRGQTIGGDAPVDWSNIVGIGREVTGLRKDGTRLPIHLAIGEARMGGRRLFTAIVHDLSRRRFLEQQILKAASNEQRRIGHDLHDGLCQDLIGIAFSIDNVVMGLPAGDGRAAEALSRIAESIRATAGQARDLSHGLNPVDIRAGGLPMALDNLASKVSESFGVRCAFHPDPDVASLDDAAATHLYRIAQEAIHNAIKHGGATKIDVELMSRGREVVLSIADNGRGMPRSMLERIRQGLPFSGQTGRTRQAAGIGLQSMQYRARVIGGALSAELREGGGTIVTCVCRRESNGNSGKAHKMRHVTSTLTRRRRPAYAGVRPIAGQTGNIRRVRGT